MKLDKSIEPLPAGSKLRVRPRSALGLKYIELEPGPKAGQTLATGSHDRAPPGRPPTVELDEVFNMFDAKTRVGQRRSLDGIGGGLAGRGQDLNTAFAAFVPAPERPPAGGEEPGSPETRLGRFFRALGARRRARPRRWPRTRRSCS